MQPVKKNILAIGSGKGGVGKSTTALNVALLSAKSGIRTGIIDMDPLSNLGVILDLNEEDLKSPSESPKKSPEKSPSELADDLASHTRKIFSRLDLLFYREKSRTEAASLYERIFERFSRELEQKYELIIIDLPAGIVQNENLYVLPHLENLIVVTHAEPTSHVSAGGYIKAALEVNSRLHFLIWNNKYEAGIDPAFNPGDILGNYNRYAPDELRLPDSVKDRLQHVAYVPSDPSLNLLKTRLDFRLDILLKIQESLHVLYELIVPLPGNEKLPLITRRALRYYLLHEYGAPSGEGALTYLAEFFQRSMSPHDQAIVEQYIEQQTENPLRKVVAESMQIITQIMDIYRNRQWRSNSFQEMSATFAHLSPRLIHSFQIFNRLVESFSDEKIRKRFAYVDMAMLKNTLGLGFFYFALLKLLEHKRIQQVLISFIPRKKRNGKFVRDRHRQIMLLIENGRVYHQKFFNLVRTLFPLVERQLYRLARIRKLENILLYDDNGRIRRNVYLRLLSEIIHELLNAGLGIHVGIHFNRAAQEIRKGWEAVKKVID